MFIHFDQILSTYELCSKCYTFMPSIWSLHNEQHLYLCNCHFVHPAVQVTQVYNSTHIALLRCGLVLLLTLLKAYKKIKMEVQTNFVLHSLCFYKEVGVV